jgi:hypothetical protein
MGFTPIASIHTKVFRFGADKKYYRERKMMNILLLEGIRTATRSGACGECRWSGLLSLYRSK